VSPAIIDCDVHIAAPPSDDLVAHLDGHWVDFVQSTGFTEANSVAVSFPDWSAQLRRPAGELTLARVRVDVLDHVERAVLNLHAGVESFTHPYLAPAMAAATNRWLSDAWLAHDDRLRAVAVVAAQFPEAAAAEIERVASDGRFAAVGLPSRAWDPYGHDRYRSLWEAAASHQLPVAILPGGATGVAPTALGWPASLFEDYVLGAQPYQTHLTSIIMSGLLDRHPGMKIALLGSGWTWLPAFMWKLDAQWRAFRREVPWVRRPPSEYVREHVRFSAAPADAPEGEQVLPEVLEQLGSEEMMMFGSDFPHRHAITAERVLGSLTARARRRALADNARDTFRLG
jgi:uncharacterized protein